MNTVYSIKNHFENFGYCIREWLCAVVFEAAVNLAAICILHILGNQYIMRSDLSSPVRFKSNF